MMVGPVLTKHDRADNEYEDEKPAKQNIYSHYSTSGFGSVVIGYNAALNGMLNVLMVVGGDIQGMISDVGAERGTGRFRTTPKSRSLSRLESLGLSLQSSFDSSGQTTIPTVNEDIIARTKIIFQAAVAFINASEINKAMINAWNKLTPAREINRRRLFVQKDLSSISERLTFHHVFVKEGLPLSFGSKSWGLVGVGARAVAGAFVAAAGVVYVAANRLGVLRQNGIVKALARQTNAPNVWEPVIVPPRPQVSGIITPVKSALDGILTSLNNRVQKIEGLVFDYWAWVKTQPKRKKRTVVFASLEEVMDAGDRSQGSGLSGQEEVIRNTIDEIRDTKSPVGAVVQTSSSPVVDVDDPVWIAYFAAKKEQLKTVIVASIKETKAIVALAAQMAKNSMKYVLKAANDVTQDMPFNPMLPVPATSSPVSEQNSGSNTHISSIDVVEISNSKIFPPTRADQGGHREVSLASNRLGDKSLAALDPPVFGADHVQSLIQNIFGSRGVSGQLRRSAKASVGVPTDIEDGTSGGAGYRIQGIGEALSLESIQRPSREIQFTARQNLQILARSRQNLRFWRMAGLGEKTVSDSPAAASSEFSRHRENWVAQIKPPHVPSNYWTSPIQATSPVLGEAGKNAAFCAGSFRKTQSRISRPSPWKASGSAPCRRPRACFRFVLRQR